jgi:hypothetical protein
MLNKLSGENLNPHNENFATSFDLSQLKNLPLPDDHPTWGTVRYLHPLVAMAFGDRAAYILCQIHYWMTQTNSGRDYYGFRWIYNTYEKWYEQFPWLSKDTIANLIRYLEGTGVLVSNNFNRNSYLRTKWYTIDYYQLACQTGWNPLGLDLTLEYLRPPSVQEERELNDAFQQAIEQGTDELPGYYVWKDGLKHLQQANVEKTHDGYLNIPPLHRAKTLYSSIYKEISISTKNDSSQDKETDSTVKTPQDWLLEDLWDSPVEEQSNQGVVTYRDVTTTNSIHKTTSSSYSSQGGTKATREEVKDTNGCSTSSKSSNEDKSSARPRTTNATSTTKPGLHTTGTTRTTKPTSYATSATSTTKPTPRATSTTDVTGATPENKNVVYLDKPRLPNYTCEDRPLYIWEDALNYPNENFLSWRYVTHYKPQGGKWESGGRSYARKEFYNDPAGADVIYQEFLLYFNQTANVAHQQQNQEMQAVLPACLAKLPEVTQENKEQVAINIATVAARGAGVALPNNYAPGSRQHMSIEEAASGKEIKPLPELEKPALPGDAPRHWRDTLSESEKFENDFALNCTKWKLPASREKALEWALKHSDKVRVTEHGLEKILPTLTSEPIPNKQQVEEEQVEEEETNDIPEITESFLVQGNLNMTRKLLRDGSLEVLAAFILDWDEEFFCKISELLTDSEKKQVAALYKGNSSPRNNAATAPNGLNNQLNTPVHVKSDVKESGDALDFNLYADIEVIRNFLKSEDYQSLLHFCTNDLSSDELEKILKHLHAWELELISIQIALIYWQNGDSDNLENWVYNDSPILLVFDENGKPCKYSE